MLSGGGLPLLAPLDCADDDLDCQAEDDQVGDHLPGDQPGRLGFGGDVAEADGGKDGDGEVQAVGARRSCWPIARPDDNGIGGGSILAPILIGSGRRPAEVAPAALASTFVTSVAGVITFTILSIHQHGSVAPDWPTGMALGVGGLAGAYTGARLQSRVPDVLIRRLVGILVIAIGARYLWSSLG